MDAAELVDRFNKWVPGEVGAIEITLLPREDGGLRVQSATIPGLILSGPDPVKVMAAIWPALTALREYNAKKS